MKRDLDKLFDQCISQLNNGLDIETILANYPDEAAELRPLLRTVALIREVPYPTALPTAKARGKRRLLRAVAARKRERAGSRSRAGQLLDQVGAWLRPLLQPQAFPKRSEWAPMRRLAVTVATLLIALTMTGWGVTLAAANSLPDSPLYPVKLATEQIRLTLTTSSTARAQIQLDRAERRLREVRAMIEAGRGTDETVLRAMQDQSRMAWEAIAQTPEGARESLLSDFGSWAQESQEALKAVQTQLVPEEQAVLEEAISALSHDAALAEKALRRSATPSPVAETPTRAAEPQGEATLPSKATDTATLVPTKTATAVPTQVPTQPATTATLAATPVQPPMPTLVVYPDLVQPDLKPTRPAMATRTATPTPAGSAATPTSVIVTATPSAVPPTATPTEPSDITVPPIQSTPFQALPTPTPGAPTPTPAESPQVEQPPVQVILPQLATPTP